MQEPILEELGPAARTSASNLQPWHLRPAAYIALSQSLPIVSIAVPFGLAKLVFRILES